MAGWATTYRPANLSEVLGQDFPIRIIRGALKGDETPTTWLLKGPWGAGKTSIARILAKAFICSKTSAEGESCGFCEQCRAIDNEASPNYSEVDSASYGNVEAIRELIEEAKLSPIDAPMRVIVLDEAHMLTKAAQSVLLKTLEDGLGLTIMILVTTDPEKLLPTILSRCIQVPLVPVDRKTVTAHLVHITENEGVVAEEDALKLIVENTYGHIRDALNLTQQLSLAGPITLASTKEHLNLHLDEIAAEVVAMAGEKWEEAIAKLEIAVQENSAEEFWAAMRRAITQAALHHVNPQRVKPPPAILKIAEKYSYRLTSASEWVLDVGVRLQIRTMHDQVVALSILREKLGANVAQATQSTKPFGKPKSQRKETFQRPQKTLGGNDLVNFLGLQADGDNEEIKEPVKEPLELGSSEETHMDS
jgi:DNA polymerase III subunit gamma/tau